MKNKFPGRRLTSHELAEAAECLKAIAHPLRLKIIELLMEGDYTVGDIARCCGLSQPATSEHLRLLSSRGFLSKERRKKCMYYKVKERQLENILDCIRKRYNKEK